MKKRRHHKGHDAVHDTRRKGSFSTATSALPSISLTTAGVVVVIAAAGLALVSKETGLWRSAFGLGSESADRKDRAAHEATLTNGGWRLPDARTTQRLDTSRCSIDRVAVGDLSAERFQREYRHKKPVMVHFPNGARDWTEPAKWSLPALTRDYGQWQLNTGGSVEIVRRGGNGEIVTSLDTFVGSLMRKAREDTGEAKYYIFDREFYKASDLPHTLTLPAYFTPRDDLDDSFFFLGASGSGVVFHKHADTWNGVVFGRKRWFLYPTNNTPPGGVFHGFTIMNWYERIYPNLTLDKMPMECVQQGGDILYLPEGFYHATLNIGDTIAVALQKKEAMLLTEKLFYRLTELNARLSESTSASTEIHKKILDTLLQLRGLLPDSSEVAMKLGEKYGDLGQHQKAVEFLQKAIDLDPYFVLAHTALAKNLASLRRYQEAEDLFLRARALSPELWDVYKEYGMFLLLQGRGLNCSLTHCPSGHT
ncbi:uncharacterized protein LOC112572786 isoform X2 [Pomacea canaliculata]|uniref:uncharacterized protein LOC112572786 isoform X2 n=1 Tax=Pomacea canaliculata TaxID=400727 RepID=UPI000D72635B|nr:uncharacterized protein LOC112572786 isoform X2 [Pomacea canaliculata]